MYLVAGAAFLGLTFQPAFRRSRWFNLPLAYLLAGAVLGGAGLPVITPLSGETQTEVVVHVSELIVIISLAGTGLAIDLKEGWRRWQPTWRLLGIAMPLTIAALAWMGTAWLGLPLAAAMLLAASLAPTDPVLARSVQVGPPNQGDDGGQEGATRVALTSEAGLNDGLAFPFVWLAITLAGVSGGGWGAFDWLPQWLAFDLVYRVAAGIAMGWAVGWAMTRIIHSELGDGSYGGENAALTVLAATFIAYGLAEAVDGYGFLAVFVAARAGRNLTRGTQDDAYNRQVHSMADQLEQILLAVLLIWLGMFVGSGLLAGTTLIEVGFALAFIFLLRPAAGLVALAGYRCSGSDRRRIAFFGVRGMGSVFYIAYGQTHADFADMQTVWRVAAIVILVSIVVHGFSARHFMDEEASAVPSDPEAASADGEPAGPRR